MEERSIEWRWISRRASVNRDMGGSSGGGSQMLREDSDDCGGSVAEDEVCIGEEEGGIDGMDGGRI